MGEPQETKPEVGVEAVQKTWSFVLLLVPAEHHAAMAAKLAEFFQQQEKEHGQ